MEVIYKVLTFQEWEVVSAMGVFSGSVADIRDGFIHFSTAEQAIETVSRHFSDADALMLAAVSTDSLGEALRWEPSRGGAMFPHLYGPLKLADIMWAKAFDAQRLGSLRKLLPG